jgi:hypothetical protein
VYCQSTIFRYLRTSRTAGTRGMVRSLKCHEVLLHRMGANRSCIQYDSTEGPPITAEAVTLSAIYLRSIVIRSLNSGSPCHGELSILGGSMLEYEGNQPSRQRFDMCKSCRSSTLKSAEFPTQVCAVELLCTKSPTRHPIRIQINE